MEQLSKIYTFDDFRFDADKFALYYKNVLITAGDKKAMQVLAVLLLSPNELTTHDEIIERVWQDNPLGVTSNHIGQYISKLRKIFAEFAPEKNYIKTSKGRGYSFDGDVSPAETNSPTNLAGGLSAHFPLSSEAAVNPVEAIAAALPPRKFPKSALIFLVLIPILLTAFFVWTWFSDDGEQEIRRVVKESQIYESLVLYKNPAAFNDELLDKYWTSEFDLNANYDRRRIREAAKKMHDEDRRYGDETKCEQFDFQSVEINQSENLAVVKTLEKWFIAVYFNDGTLQKNKYVGPYFVSYILRKVNGRWLIEKSTTARMNRPTPIVSGIEAISEIKPGRQFFVKITGQDFEAETVSIEVVGEGCPESRPCKVPNTVLRENSKLTDIALDNVPLTLTSGDFQIVVHNGDSPASNPWSVKVP